MARGTQIIATVVNLPYCSNAVVLPVDAMPQKSSTDIDKARASRNYIHTHVSFSATANTNALETCPPPGNQVRERGVEISARPLGSTPPVTVHSTHLVQRQAPDAEHLEVRPGWASVVSNEPVLPVLLRVL